MAGRRGCRMRRGFNTLAAQAEKVLELDPYSGHLFVFRGRRGDLLKIIWWDSQGACLFSKRLERGRFVWPAAKDGEVSVTAAQLPMLLQGLGWRMGRKNYLFMGSAGGGKAAAIAYTLQDERHRSRGMAHLGVRTTARSQDQPHR